MSPLAVISTVPAFVSAEERGHISASTPSSFSDIPPVLRHKEHGLSATLDPPLDGFEDGAIGTLYVIESVLVFMPPTGCGFQISYPAITLHATSRAQGRPSLYCQLDMSDPNGDTCEGDTPDVRELTLVPSNPESLEPIFEALSHCASLHPDPNVSDDDELEGVVVSDERFETFDGDEGEELSQVGRAALAHLESLIDGSGVDTNGSLDAADEISSEQGEIKD